MVRKSAWSFKTSGGLSGGGPPIGEGPFSVGLESQSFTLVDPQGVEAVFTYQAFNVSIGKGPKSNPSLGISGSTEDMGAEEASG